MALQQIIDRRLAGKNKSVGNRERFLRRHQAHIREAVRRAVDGRGIREVAGGADVHVPKKDLAEPVFQHGEGGVRERVHPGTCGELLAHKILPRCRYFAYVQVAADEQQLWQVYSELARSQPGFALRKATEAGQIYPVFRDLFKKERAGA